MKPRCQTPNTLFQTIEPINSRTFIIHHRRFATTCNCAKLRNIFRTGLSCIGIVEFLSVVGLASILRHCSTEIIDNCFPDNLQKLLVCRFCARFCGNHQSDSLIRGVCYIQVMSLVFSIVGRHVDRIISKLSNPLETGCTESAYSGRIV